MNVTFCGTLRRRSLHKRNREEQKPPRERPQESAFLEDEIEDLFFGDTPFAPSAGDVE